MWFKRKKKNDPDSALTDSLRSLQVLLNDRDGGKRVEPKVSTTVEDGTLIQDTDSTPALAVDVEDDGIPVLTSDIDRAPSLRPGARLDLPTRDRVETDETVEIPITAETEEYTEYNIGSAASDQTGDDDRDGDSDTPTFDNIPVLNDAVFIPEAATPPAKPSDEEIAAKEALIEASVADFNQRLDLNNLPPLTEQDKQKLRQTLALLLVTRNTVVPH